MSSTSCQRFSRGEPGTLVWASSSIRATAGWRAMIASVSISSTVTPWYSTCRRGTISRPSSSAGVRGRPCDLHVADDDVGAALEAAVALLEHAVRLADARGHAQVEPQPAARAALFRRHPGEHLVAASAARRRAWLMGREYGAAYCRGRRSSPSRSRLSSRTLTAGSPMNPSSGCVVCRATIARTASSVMPRAAATRATWYSAAAGLMSGSRPDAEVVTRSTGIGAPPLAACSAVDLRLDVRR